MGTESEVFLVEHVPSASLLFEPKTVPFHSRLIMIYYATFSKGSVNKLFQDKAPRKSDFVIKNLSTTKL